MNKLSKAEIEKLEYIKILATLEVVDKCLQDCVSRQNKKCKERSAVSELMCITYHNIFNELENLKDRIDEELKILNTII